MRGRRQLILRHPADAGSDPGRLEWRHVVPDPAADGCAREVRTSGEEAGLAEVIRYDLPGDGHAAAQHPVASVAALNLSPEPGDPGGNHLLAERAITQAKRECPSLRWVVLPELFTCGYSDLESAYRYAEDAERGQSVRFLHTLAGELAIFIAYGFPERAPDSVHCFGVFDSANLVGPEGGTCDLPQAQPREDDA